MPQLFCFFISPSHLLKETSQLKINFQRENLGYLVVFLSHKDLMGAAETRACYSIDRGLLEFTYTGLFLVRFITSHFHNYKKLKIKFINFRMCLFLILSGDQG